MKSIKIVLGSLLAIGVIIYGAYSSAEIVKWKDVDPNCNLTGDITFTGLDGKKYTRAACNSTLGGVARQYGSGGLDYGNGIYPCQKTTKVSNPTLYYSYLTKETDIAGGICKMNNIMGKMYSWTYLQSNCKAASGNNFAGTNNTNCACPDGWHVPTKDEFQTAKNYYMVYANSPDPDQYIGWGGSATASGLAMQFKLPLNGIGDSSNFGLRGQYGYYWSSTFSGTNQSYAYALNIMGQGISTYLGTDYASRVWLTSSTYNGIRKEMGVRCIKDERTEPIFFTSKSYIQSGSEYVGTGSFNLQDIYDEKGGSIIGLNIKMQSTDSKTTVSIPAGTKITKSDGTTDYTGTISTPIILSTGSISGELKGVVGLARVGNVGESILLKDLSGNDVTATVKIPVTTLPIGSNVSIKYSNDGGLTWYNMGDTTVIRQGSESYVEFTTTHFTDFAVVYVGVPGNIYLQILTGLSDCKYGTSLYLGEQNVKFDESYLFTGAFTGEWYCADYKGYTGGRVFTIQTSSLTNENGNFISGANLLISHDLPVLAGDNSCTGGVGTAREFYSTGYVMFEKIIGSDKLCRVSTTNVGLQINVPANQSPGSYTGTLTIYIPNFF